MFFCHIIVLGYLTFHHYILGILFSIQISQNGAHIIVIVRSFTFFHIMILNSSDKDDFDERYELA